MSAQPLMHGGADRETLPPGPRLPRLMQTFGFLLARDRFVEQCRRRYGDILAFHTTYDSGFVMVFDPDLVGEVFRAPRDRACGGAANAGVLPLHGDRSLLCLGGAEHLRHRNFISPLFRGDRLRAYEAVIRDVADHTIDEWPVGEPFALLPSMLSLTLQVMIRVVFGVEQRPRADALRRAAQRTFDPVDSSLNRLITLLSGGWFRSSRSARSFVRNRRVIHDLVRDEISMRRSNTDLEQRPDVLSALILARDSAGRGLTDAELKDELITLLFAGHETSATGLAWGFELLLRNPTVLGRLRESLAGGERDYLDAVVKETLRLRPVAAGVGRKVLGAPLEIGGYLIPPGVEIAPSISGIHRRGDIYPQPRAFRPERFLEKSVPDGAWLAFGGGTRRCLGASFALMEMRTVLQRVLERTHLAPVGRRPEKGVARALMPPTPRALGRSLSRGRRLLPEHGTRVVLVRRTAA